MKIKTHFLLCLTIAYNFNMNAQSENYSRTYIEATMSQKDSWHSANSPANTYLHFDDPYLPVSDNEFNGLKQFALLRPLPTHNYDNYYFGARSTSYALEWIYKKDGDIASLNRAIEIARRAIQYRLDNIHLVSPNYPQNLYADFTRGDDRGAVWPNFKNKGELVVNDRVYIGCGAGVFAGFPVITVPIRMIANNPTTWNSVYDGKTYREIADELILEALRTIDYTYDNLVNQNGLNDNLIRYANSTLEGSWTGRVYIYNRVFPIISGAIPLVEALEIFGIIPDRVTKIDQVNTAMMAYIMNDFTWLNTNGLETPYYPYSDEAQNRNPSQSEDFTHGSLDGRDLQYIYVSRRYGYTKRFVDGIANTLVEVVINEDGTYTERLSGAGAIESSKSPLNYDGYLWYTPYNTELKSLLIDNVVSNGILVKSSSYDMNNLFELLKLKDSNYQAVSLSTKNNRRKKNFKVYPNPFRSQLIINDLNGMYDEVSLRDTTGRNLLSQKIKDKSDVKLIIPDNLPKGFYLLNLKGINSLDTITLLHL